MLDDALQMLVSLTVANRRRDRSETLADASGRLDALRITLRLSQRLGFLSNGGYAQLSAGADEIGRMLGGWMKRDGGRGGASPEPGRRVRAVTAPSSILPRQAGEIIEGVPGADSAAPSTRIANPVEGHAPSCPPADANRHPGGVRYKMTSPTVEKYLRVKLDHPGAIVFVTVGAFCQTFFEDAVYCQLTLRLALRNLAAASEPEKIPVCGIPRDKLDKYVALLQQAGRTVHVE